MKRFKAIMNEEVNVPRWVFFLTLLFWTVFTVDVFGGLLGWWE